MFFIFDKKTHGLFLTKGRVLLIDMNPAITRSDVIHMLGIEHGSDLIYSHD